MAKLPPDFVKAPVFDNPIRSTSTLEVNSKTREIVLRLDETLFAALQEAAIKEKTTPAELAKRLLKEWVDQRNQPAPSAPASGHLGSAPASGHLGSAPASERPLSSSLAARLLGLVSARLRKLPLIEASWAWAVERVRPEPRDPARPVAAR